MNANFRSLVEHLEPKLATLRSGKPSKPLEVPRSPRRAGVYLFSEGDRPLYVGRTRNLGARIRNHAKGPNSNTATFAFLLARKATGKIKAMYLPAGSREALLGDPVFRREFDKAKQPDPADGRPVRGGDGSHAAGAPPVRQRGSRGEATS